jgi:hypothetical protein
VNTSSSSELSAHFSAFSLCNIWASTLCCHGGMQNGSILLRSLKAIVSEFEPMSSIETFSKFPLTLSPLEQTPYSIQLTPHKMTEN